MKLQAIPEPPGRTPKRYPLIGRSVGKASLWDCKKNKQLSSQPTKVISGQGSQFNGYVLELVKLALIVFYFVKKGLLMTTLEGGMWDTRGRSHPGLADRFSQAN